MLRGLSTVSFYADDLDAASAWYTEVLGIEPYFTVPGYVEFRIGDFQQELGVIDSRYAPTGSSTGTGGAIVYWHVDDLTSSYRRLLDLGATEFAGPIVRGEGFVTASVVDPFGNVLGIMTNQHFLEVVGRLSSR